jgi:hypothetical protein
LKRISSVVLLTFLVAVCAARAEAIKPEDSRVADRWEFNLGGLVTGLNTVVRFDEVVGNQGTTLNLEDDLGFDSSELVLDVGIARVLGRRHILALDYLEVDREGSLTTSTEIVWGDEVFPVNARLNSFYDAEFISLTYTYLVRSREKSAWGPVIGLVLFSTGSGVDVAGGAEIGPGVSVASDFSIDVPVPLIGIEYRQALPKRWVFVTKAAFVKFDDIDDLSGDVIIGGASFEHHTWEKVGFGVGFGLRDFDIDSGEKRTLGQYRFEVRGFNGYLRVGF